jgi:multicomponent Na+:H+ antiporter subunit G
MENVMAYIGLFLLWVGVFFSVVGIIGLLRFPDVFTRIHSSGKVTTLGAVFLLAGVVCFMPQLLLKAIVLGGFLILTTPVASHSIAIAAHRNIERLRYGTRDDLADAREGKLPPLKPAKKR